MVRQAHHRWFDRLTTGRTLKRRGKMPYAQLDGLRVLEFGRFISAHNCGKLLASPSTSAKPTHGWNVPTYWGSTYPTDFCG
jgi:hypothetical protein